jgi:hypothetical protein
MERDYMEDLGVEGRILKWICKKWDVVGVDLISLAQDRDRWQAPVNTIMNLRVP